MKSIFKLFVRKVLSNKFVICTHRCCCWSPKGKQLVVGRMSGNISQLRLDLTEAKQISGPETGSVPISILWTQTTQFLIVFHKESYIGMWWCTKLNHFAAYDTVNLCVEFS